MYANLKTTKEKKNSSASDTDFNSKDSKGISFVEK